MNHGRNLFKEFFEIHFGKIEDLMYKTYDGNFKADAFVNAASPSLMGGDAPSVDSVIHEKINQLNGGNPDFFKNEIKKELDRDEKGEVLALDDDVVRCHRGKAVVTKGYSLCKKIIHTVGPTFETQKGIYYPSSMMDTLESCYKEILRAALADLSIQTLAIPVISSGNYKMDFEQAFKVELVTLYNELLELKNKDRELFGYLSLKKIYLVIYDQNGEKEIVQKVIKRYKKCFEREHRAVSRMSWQSQWEYLKEIFQYDRKRGYFSLAKISRIILVVIRLFLFAPTNSVKDIFGRRDWIKRRQTVEILAGIKILIPIAGYFILRLSGYPSRMSARVSLILLYFLADTVTYLLVLIVLADIQRPSANIIRSMITLFINYVEVSLNMSVIYFVKYHGAVLFRKALAFVFLNIDSGYVPDTYFDYAILCLNYGIKFFFVSMVFGYFSNHLQQRKFRSACNTKIAG